MNFDINESLRAKFGTLGFLDQGYSKISTPLSDMLKKNKP